MSEPPDNIERTDDYTAGYRGGWNDATARAADRIDALEAALREIKQLADSDDGISPREAIDIADAALDQSSPPK